MSRRPSNAKGKGDKAMKRFLILIALAALVVAASTAPVSAGWQREPIKTSYDSLGVFQISDSEASGADLLDTASTWVASANGHAASEVITVAYYEDGGGMYTYAYLWAHMTDSCATTDSNRFYVVLEQSMGGDGTPTEDAFWEPVDSVLFNGGAVPTGKKVTLNGMPLLRVRNQLAAKTPVNDTLSCIVKLNLIR
jgi:hypothetical protein